MDFVYTYASIYKYTIRMLQMICVFFAFMHQLCGLIINTSDQLYTDSKLQCHCERKDPTVHAYIIHHIEYNMYFKEETLIENISPKVILCWTYNDIM